MLVDDVLKLAARHGLNLTSDLTFNEQGLDFRVVFAKDQGGQSWVLRIPRRTDVLPKMEYEAKVLKLVKRRLPVQVPDWQVCTSDLVAYPYLSDKTALTFDAETYAVTWNIDQHSDAYIDSFAEVLVALHQTPVADAVAAGITHATPEMARKNFLAHLERVKSELGMSQELETQWRRWLDDDRLWPSFSVLVHGDLYAGHVTADANSRVSGVIDWTEAEVSDPSIDFAGHLSAFSPESLEKLVAAYARAGGQTWPTMVAHITARHAASPIRYGLFAIVTKNQAHITAAKAQLGVS